MRLYPPHTFVFVAAFGALATASACDGQTAAPPAMTTDPSKITGFEITKPAYADGTLETVLRRVGDNPIQIETDKPADAVELSIDGGAYVALTRESDWTFTGAWTVTAADNGAHTLTFRVHDDAGVAESTVAWRVQIWDRDDALDTRSFSGLTPVLELDPAKGVLWLLYRTNVGETELTVAHKGLGDTAWTSEVVVPDASYELVDGGGRNPWHLSMDLDSKGNPHFVSTWDVAGDNQQIGLGYFHHDGAGWEQEMIVPAAQPLVPGQADTYPYYSWEGTNVALALAADDTPHVLFYRNLATTASLHNGSLWYGRREAGGTWTLTQLTDDLGDIYQPVGFDRAGLAAAFDDAGTTLVFRFVSHEQGEGQLRYGVLPSGAATPTLGVIASDLSDYSWDRGSEGSLLYAGGQWVTSFHAVASKGSLYVARFDGATWTSELVDEGGLGEYSAIAADPQGNLHVTYRGPMNSLRHAREVDGGWLATEIGLETEVEQVRLGDPGQTSLRIDATGKAHLVFYNTFKKLAEYWTTPLQ